MFTDLLQVDIKWLYPVKSDYIDKGHLKIGPVSDKNDIFRKTYLSKLKDIFVPNKNKYICPNQEIYLFRNIVYLPSTIATWLHLSTQSSFNQKSFLNQNKNQSLFF